MPSSHSTLRVLLLISLMLFVPVALVPAAPQSANDGATSPASLADEVAPALTGEPGWVAAQTRGEVGVSRVLVLRLPQPAEETRELSLTVEPAESLEILAPLRVEAGHRLAFVRVRPTVAGEVTLTGEYIDDDDDTQTTSCVLHVDPRSAPPSPEMVSPKPGAVLFGELLVGGRAPVEATQPVREPVAARLLGRSVATEGAEWEMLHEQTAVPRLDVFWRLRAPLDATALPQGHFELAWQLDYSDGVSQSSAPTPVRIAHPDPETLLGGDAQDLAQLELPEEFRDRRQPRIVADPAASGGAYTAHHSARPPLRIPVEAGEHGGYYQMAIVARSDYAIGAHATVGIWFDEQRNDFFPERTPLLEETWHRVMVGAPVYVPPGEHWLAANFMNDVFRRGLWDRNLFIDRLELLPLTDAPQPRDLRIEWIQSPAGAHVSGAFQVRGRIRRVAAEQTPLVPTWLEVNGERIAKQISEQPRFHVPATAFRPGENTARLVLDLDEMHVARTHRGEAGIVATPMARFTWQPPLDDQGEPLPPIDEGLIRITAFDDKAWLDGPLRYDRGAPDGMIAAFHHNGSATVRLPEELTGQHEVRLFCRADSFEGDPLAEVTLNDEPIGELNVRGGWWGRRVATVEFDEGEKVLNIAYTNDHYEEGVGDRNLFVSAVELRPVPHVDQAHVPQVRWLYPAKDGSPMARADAFVFDVVHPHGIDWVRLRHDGAHVPGGFRTLRADAEGRVCLPIYLRDFEGGEHTFTMQVRDLQGRTHEIAPRTVTLTDDADATPYAACVHLLNRFGYGMEPALLAQLLLAEDPVAQLETWLRADADAMAIQESLARLPNHRSIYHVTRRVLDVGLHTDNPARFRLQQFWENHFSTWIRKARAERKWPEHQRLCAATNARFRTLLEASATSPAMLVFLDQHTSFAGRLNENYAREILELHTLGVDGGYTQEDVEKLARLLTGFSITSDDQWDRFYFLGPLHEREEQTILGYRFAAVAEADANDHEALRQAGLARGMEALDQLAAHPSTAHFIAQKLVGHYYAYPAPAEVVAELAQVYLETDGDVVAMLVALARSPRFAHDVAPPLILDPLDFGFAWSRRAGYRSADQLGRFLDAAQRMIMDLDTPDGYSYDPADWLDSSSILQRWRYAELAANSARANHGSAVFNSVGTRDLDERFNEATLDHVAMMMLGLPLDPDEHTFAMEVMAEAEGNHNRRFALAVSLVGQFPQAQLR